MFEEITGSKLQKMSGAYRVISKNQHFKIAENGVDTVKTPPNKTVFGILCSNDKVFAELVNDTKVKDLIPIIMKKVKKGAPELK